MSEEEDLEVTVEVARLHQQIEDARFELSRGVLNLVVARPDQTLAEVVAEVVKEFQCTAVVGDCEECEDHVCECDCDEDELSRDQRAVVRAVINDLKELL